eukprot:19667-Heterococcus_DN1.PRE.2
MVNVVDVKCAQEGCQKIPSFGHVHDGKALFCNAHKEPSMVNVVNPQCAREGCRIRPAFGHCAVKDCERQASHGLLSDKVPRYCARHSVDRDGAVHLCTPYCIADGCLKRPLFGSADDRQVLYCTEHAHEHPEKQLVNLTVMTCEETTCTARSAWGYSADNVLRRCKAHILPGMINVTHRYCESCNQRIK